MAASLLKDFVGTLSSALDFNQATLSGAIDVIVVEHDDGTMRSTPFHVRFGKLQLLRPKEKLVTIRINGNKVGFGMKMGRAGEAFFVEASSAPVDRDLATSPLQTPINSPKISPQHVEHRLHTNTERNEKDCFHDMDVLVLNSDNEFNDDDDDGGGDDDDDDDGAAATIIAEQAFVDDVTAVLEDIITRVVNEVIASTLTNSVTMSINEATVALEDTLLHQSDDGVDQTWTWWSWGWGSFPVRKVSQTHFLHEEVYAEAPKSSVTNYNRNSFVASETNATSTSSSNSWMSSIFGIFRRSTTHSGHEQIHDEPNVVNVRVFVTKLGHVQVQLDFVTSDSEPLTEQNNTSTHNSDRCSESDEKHSLRWAASQSYSGLDTTAPSFSSDKSDPKVTSSNTPVIEMSLCGFTLGINALENAVIFQRSLVTFEHLCSCPDLVFRPELVVRYGDVLYPGRVALPLLLSYAAFGRSLEVNALNQLAKAESPNREGIAVAVQRMKDIDADNQSHSLNNDDDDDGDDDDDDKNDDDDDDDDDKNDDERTQRHITNVNPQAKSSRNFIYRWFAGREPVAQYQEHTTFANIDDAATTTCFTETAFSLPDGVGLNALVNDIGSSNELLLQDIVNDAQHTGGIGHETHASILPLAFKKSLRPSSNMLRELNLQPGRNLISFSVTSALQGTQTLEASIYLWDVSSHIVISDVDGTITRSDLLGNLMPLFGKDWSQSGVTSLFTNIARNGYNVLYLTSRAMAQANITRDYLHSVRQGSVSLPEGPLIMSPDSLIHSFKREIIYRRPQDFKIPALRDVRELFSPQRDRPFFAGFGNRLTDMESYVAVGVPSERVFVIDPRGNIHYSTHTLTRASYPILNEKVEHMFPALGKREVKDEEADFNEFNFWRLDIRALPFDDEVKTNEDISSDKNSETSLRASNNNIINANIIDDVTVTTTSTFSTQQHKGDVVDAATKVQSNL